MKLLRDRPDVIASLIAGLIWGVCKTVRIRVHDPDGLLANRPDHPLLWAFWHDRIFTMPYFYAEYMPGRGGTVLTSASADGEIIAQVISHFGGRAVRGSTSRRARAALVGCIRTLRAGHDLFITPDGPRGPRRQMQPGLVKIASITGTPILPIAVQLGPALRLGTWDRFAIPVPFSKVSVHLRPLEHIAPDLDEPALASERNRISKLLHPPTESP